MCFEQKEETNLQGKLLERLPVNSLSQRRDILQQATADSVVMHCVMITVFLLPLNVGS